MNECKDCGSEVQNKNAAGHYRDRCCVCISRAAGLSPAEGRPIPGCTCEVCEGAR